MTSRGVEISVGLFVALGLAALLVLAMKVSNLSEVAGGEGYTVTAHFDNVGGLKIRSPVTMAGVRVGRVSAISFNDQDYVAVVAMTIDDNFRRIPTDSSASIFTAGLLGEQYIGLEAGGEDVFLKDQDQLELTQSAIVLEQVIGQILYSQAGKEQ